MYRIQSFLLLFKCIVHLLLRRPFGAIIYDICNKYDELDIGHLRKFEKLAVKCRKAELDIQFLKNCKLLGVTPKFPTFPFPSKFQDDIRGIKKRLLKSATQRRIADKTKLERDRDEVKNFIRSTVSGMNFFILYKAIGKNVRKFEDSVIKTHSKKLSNLTYNHSLPFSASEVIQNKSSYSLSKEEEDILKYGLKYALHPMKISRSDVFCTFEKVNSFFKKDLKDMYSERHISAELQTLAETYVSSYRPPASTLKK